MRSLKAPFRPLPRIALLLLPCWLACACPLQAQTLQIRPQALDLGTVKLGTRQKAEIFLANLGDDELDLEAGVTGEAFLVYPASLRLPAGEERAVELVFEARQEGEYESELILQVKGFLKTEKFPVPLRAVVARAGIRIEPDPAQGVDMGALPVGEMSRRIVRLVNPGGVVLSIDAIALAEEVPAFQVAVPDSVDLAPGEEIELQIVFRPESEGTCENLLVLTSADLIPPRMEIRLSGRGLAPEVLTSPLPEVGMAFGDLELGQTRLLQLTVLNRGPAPLRVDSLAISSGAYTTSWDPAAAAPVDSGQFVEIPVLFRPRYEGRASAKLIFRCNDPKRPVVEIPLSGSARQTPPKIEVLNEDVIDFGSIAIGKKERDHLLVWNRGGTPFTVTMALEGEASAEFELEIPSRIRTRGSFPAPAAG
jgi:hypothetical protein